MNVFVWGPLRPHLCVSSFVYSQFVSVIINYLFHIFLYKYTEIENIKSEGLQEKGGDFARSQNERSAQATLTSSLTLWKEQRLV